MAYKYPADVSRYVQPEFPDCVIHLWNLTPAQTVAAKGDECFTLVKEGMIGLYGHSSMNGIPMFIPKSHDAHEQIRTRLRELRSR